MTISASKAFGTTRPATGRHGDRSAFAKTVDLSRPSAIPPGRVTITAIVISWAAGAIRLGIMVYN
jgi:hypothetical protein